MATADLTASIFDVTGAAGAQFFAMLMGAVLASGGGFFVAWMLDRMERTRQERSIALVCLDLLTSLGVMTNLAQGARSRGNPYGPFTMRLVRGCMRDLDVYERNRERIADISDPQLRAEIYQCMTRMVLAVDGILSETDMIVALDDSIHIARTNGDEVKLRALTADREERCARRDGSFEFMMDTTKELCSDLSVKLRALAKAEPQNLEAIVAANAVASAPSPTPASSS
jgi:hypothetical protein